MSVWFAMFLGLVQGLTEFLPVSSSGHLAIFQNFFGMGDVEADFVFFSVLLHFATLLAVSVFFWKDIKAMCVEFGRLFSPKHNRSVQVPPPRRLLFLLILGTLPLILFVFFSNTAEGLTEQPLFIGIALCATGILLLLTSILPKGKKDERSATVVDVLCVGFMQGLATIPGLSRSGTTIFTGIMRGFDRKFAMRFSFLMSIPAILGATVLKLKDAFTDDIDHLSLLPAYILGMLAAAITGYLALCLLRRVMEKGSLNKFSFYCIVVGAATIVASFFFV